MPRIERAVRDLVADDPEMQTAVETVLDRAEDGTVRWVDVRDEITSGQWGRLIERGVLVDGEEGFELADGEAARAAVDGHADDGADAGEAASSDDDDSSSWSKYDKGAAGVSGVFMLAYTWQPLQNAVGSTIDVVVGPVQNLLPFYAVVMLLAVLTGLYSTILQANLMDTEKMAMYQERMQDLQDRRKAAKERDDEEALDEIKEEQMEMMGDQLGMFKEQFRPMVWIMFLTIPVFLWMYWGLGIGGGTPHIDPAGIVIPFKGPVDWREGALGPIQVWILWYFLCSMGFTQIIRKGLNIDISPT